ncbi:hypothetical protein GF386_06075 [Candidatus Pacearchaeota archaeon]|nr:hypothetical protein [Candidatus Pacearchaeota archaeon]MBD3283657.1 hypothetical protein [Candidatus Pacearchaeota archaeon]
MIDVNKLDLEFEVDVNISEKYKRIRAGNDVKANITIINLKDISFSDVTLYIALKDFYGNIYDSSDEPISFQQSLSVERSLNMPPDASNGEYLFYARVFNENSSSIDSDIFYVGLKFKFAAFLKSSFIFVLISVLCIFSVILTLRYIREKQKERILSLYLLLNELKSLIKEGKYDKAIELYTRVKSAYGEPVSKSAIENKEKLRQEIDLLSKNLKEKLKQTKTDITESKKKQLDSKQKKPTQTAAKPAQPKPSQTKKPVSAKPAQNQQQIRQSAKQTASQQKPGQEPAPVQTSQKISPKQEKTDVASKKQQTQTAAKPAQPKPSQTKKPVSAKPAQNQQQIRQSAEQTASQQTNPQPAKSTVSKSESKKKVKQDNAK